MEKANNPKRTPPEEIGLHVVLWGGLALLVVLALALLYAIFAYQLLPTIWHRLAAALILIVAVWQGAELVRATYREFFVTRRSR